MILADLHHPGSESADQRRAHRNRGREYRWIEESIDRKVGELFHTFIVNELRARFDEVSGRFDGGVVPHPAQTTALDIGSVDKHSQTAQFRQYRSIDGPVPRTSRILNATFWR